MIKIVVSSQKFSLPTITSFPVNLFRMDWERGQIEETTQDPSQKMDKFWAWDSKEWDLENIINPYFEILIKASIPISGEMLLNKARELALSAGILNLGVSNGYLQNFKDFFIIGSLDFCGEARKVPQDQVDSCIIENKALINSYGPDLTHNCDVTGIFYNMIYDKTMAGRGKDTMLVSRANFGSH